jgi:hypothetical protein
LYGLVLTSAVWVYASVILIDLVAYQCGSREGCGGGRWFLWPWGRSWVAAEPARGIAVAAGVLMVAVLGLALLTRRSQEFMHREYDDRERFARADDPTWRVGLRDRWFWRSPQVAHRLGMTHTSAALATVGVGAATVLDRTSTAQFASFFVAVFAVVLVVDAILVMRLDGISQWVHRGVLYVTGLAAAAFEVWALLVVDAESAPGPAPGATVLARWTFVLHIAILLLLLAGLVPRLLERRAATSRSAGPKRPILLPVVLLTAAIGPVNAVGSGLLIATADTLGDAVPASEWARNSGSFDTPIVYADVVGGTAVMTALALLLVALLAVVAWRRSLARAPTFAEVRAWYRDVTDLDQNQPGDVAWARRVGKAVAVAKLTDRAAGLVTFTGVAVAAVALAASVASGFSSSGASLLLFPSLHEPASLLLGLLPLALVALLNRSYRSPGLRRGIGTFWDVATFWPRWFHPWAPPSYGERAVPQLRVRLHNLASAHRVILSAHSQGTVIAVATLASMLPNGGDSSHEHRRVVLVTHGSPLGRLYARYFPDYFDQSLFTAVADLLGDEGDPIGWYNLRRSTDYIGGEIFPDPPARAVDRHVLDPESPRSEMPGEAPPPIQGHSNYYRQTEYRRIIIDITVRHAPPA